MPADLENLQPDLRAAVDAASSDLRRQGILLDSHITSGYRSTEHQAELWAHRAENPNPVARPGHSPHERGQAVDISMVGWGLEQQQAVIATLQRHGLSRPVANDPVHWQLAVPGQAIPPQPDLPAIPPIFPINPLLADRDEEQKRYPTDGTMLPLSSSMLSAAGYREESRELICEFVKTGRVYTYSGVPAEVWNELMDAASKGTFMREAIIGVYPF